MARFLAISVWSVSLIAQTTASLNPEGISANLEAGITEAGALKATFRVNASGAGSLPYRDAYLVSIPTPSRSLFGTFILNRQFQSVPIVKNAMDPALPFEIEFPILEDDFIIPVQRQAIAQFTLLPTLPLPVVSEGKVQLGSLGIRHEEIRFEIPANFVTQAEKHLDESRDFAHYRSDAKIEDGRLVIIRELEVKQSEVSAANRTEVEALWKIVRTDQESAFVFRRIARTDPTSWISSVPAARANFLGGRALQQREYDAARQLFEKSIAANPTDRFAWNNLGRALAALGRLEEAQKAYQTQLTINPSDPYAYNNLGLVQERMGNWSQAIESLRKQLEVHPGDSAAIGNLPRALIHEKRWAELETAASAAARAQPANPAQRLSLAIARVCLGTAADARQEMDSALGAAPPPAGLNNAAYYLTECGKEAALAESYIRRALDALNRGQISAMQGMMSVALGYQNTRSTFLDTYGWLLLKTGQTDRAIGLFEAAVALVPRAEVYVHLAQAETIAGRSDRAVIYWREAAFLEPEGLYQVPAELATQLKASPPLSLDRTWYPLKADLPKDARDALRPEQPCYFFVIANPDGTVQSARELDSNDPVAKQILPDIRSITFRPVQVDAISAPTVHILKVGQEKDGRVMVARSVSTEAVAIASELAPGEFPLPPPVASPATSVNGIGSGVTPPRVLEKVEPIYSEEARRAHLSGTVLLRGTVGIDGVIHDLATTRSLGMGLDEKAIQAVTTWQFQPGTKDGKPVAVLSNIEVNFRLGDDPRSISWHTARVEFLPPEGASRPLLEIAKAIQTSGHGHATAALSFEVNEQGVPENIQVETASDDNWARDVITMLRSWRFTPGRKDGGATSVPSKMEFVRDN